MHTVELSSIPISNFSQALFHRNLISPQIPIPFLYSSNICLSSAKPPQMALSCSGLTFKLHVLECQFMHIDCVQRWCDEKGNTNCEICLYVIC
ncbi:putative Zinc finger, RING-CH-type, Zinc finger, RING/FYVE/PHD-type [Helianthus annuus]|nr:putative Zinc finger, RING-CH-type, Zinc finger, RING/FYVE/PHD-type [Helianthus annuus]